MAAISLSSESEAEIRAGVQSGKIATAYESQIEYHGWVSEGYIVIDPDTGIGAYKIAGGDDGAAILGILLIRLKFFIGLWSGFKDKYPLQAKFLTGSVGLGVAAITRIHKLLTSGCSHTAAAIGVIITIGWNLAFLTLNLGLIAATGGLSMIATYALNGLEYYLESLVLDLYIEKACGK